MRIVVPASNEESRIANTVVEYCQHFGHRARVVVVANGCEDETERIVLMLQQRFENLALISINAKIGKGGAVRVGFLSGVEPLVGFTDADGSTSAREFDRLMTHLREFEADGIIGSRWLKGAVMQRPQPLSRRIASRVFNAVVRVLFGLRYRDTQCGAKIFVRSAIERVFPHLEVSNFAFDVDLLYQLNRKGCTVIEWPIAWSESFKASQVRLLSASCSMLLAIIRLRLRDSLLARIAFFDYLARRSVIPVRHSCRSLILVVRSQFADELARHWQEGGHTVEWIMASGFRSRLRVLVWYVFFGRREYDAVIEVPSTVPYLIPAFSIKPRFLIEFRNSPPRLARSIYRRWYRRVRRISADDDIAAREHADNALQAIKASGMYLALFDRQDGNWSITFTDNKSHTTKRQQL